MSHKIEDVEVGKRRFPFCLFTTIRRKEIGRYVVLWDHPEHPEHPDESTNFSTPFCSNGISTCQYSLSTFIPKNIWQQFHRLSNIYFLCISVLQTVPEISVTNRIPTTMFPLSFLLIVNAIKDAFEDRNRYKADRLENNQTAYRLFSEAMFTSSQSYCYIGPTLCDDYAVQKSLNDNATFHETNNSISFEVLQNSLISSGLSFEKSQAQSMLGNKPVYKTNITHCLTSHYLEETVWEKICIGDFVLIRDQDCLPADMVILGSSDSHGMVYVETASLDGETNLKLKHSPLEVSSFLGCELQQALESAWKLKGAIQCSPKDPSLESFDGVLYLDLDGIKKEISLMPQNLLLRGSKLARTHWALGIVVYTGSDTKTMQSSTKTSGKLSQLDIYTNKMTIAIFSVQICLCLVTALGSYVSWLNFARARQGKIPAHESIYVNSFPLWFFMWIVFFANMVPISLIVTMGIVKAVQATFISFDLDMYDPATDSYAVVRRSNLNDDLGCITHIFSDKTGTLTCNEMKFKRCCINGIDYGQSIDKTEARYPSTRKNSSAHWPYCDEAFETTTPSVNIVDGRLNLILQQSCHEEYKNVVNFFLHLAVNHSVIVEKDGDQFLGFSATSSDEQALVYGASHFRVKFKDRLTRDTIVLSVLDQTVHVTVLAFLDFTSTRKRTSVLCRIESNEPLGWNHPRYVLFCKGADSVVIPRCSPCIRHENLEKPFLSLKTYASEGLRIICLGKRDLSPEFVNEWHKKYQQFVAQRGEGAQRAERHVEELEVDMDFQGIAGIEDRIQDGVEDTLTSLRAAGINIWMLTGDKLETAINIGLSTGLFTQDTYQIIYQYEALQADVENLYLENVNTDSQGDKCTASREQVNTQQPFAFSNYLQHVLFQKLISDIELCKQKNPCERPLSEHSLVFRVMNRLAEIKKELWYSCTERTLPVQPTDALPPYHHVPSFQAALIVDGRCLDELLKVEFRGIFLTLCSLCSTVICSRASPGQKHVTWRPYLKSELGYYMIRHHLNLSLTGKKTQMYLKEIVCLVKEVKKSVTLAIGDGGNDCSMIQSAHVGVGIRGSEGLQAFNVSDYGISQFQFLKILLLCHGRWCHRRISFLILYMFYKNLVIALPMFYFSFFSSFAGAKLYFDLIYQLYNILFTSIPILIFGIFDQDMSKPDSLRYPQLYSVGRKQLYSTRFVSLCWVVNAVVHSCILFFVPMQLLFDSVSLHLEHPVDLYILGHCIYITVLITINVKLLLQTATITWLAIVSAFFSVFVWFVVMACFSSFPHIAPHFLALLYIMLRTPIFYVVVILAPLLALVFDFTVKVFQILYFKVAPPSLTQLS